MYQSLHTVIDNLTHVQESPVDETKTEISQDALAIHGIYAHNLDAAAAYLRFYNDITGNVTVGTTIPDHVLNVSSDGRLILPPSLLSYLEFDTALTIAVTAGGGLTDATAPGLGLYVELFNGAYQQ